MSKRYGQHSGANDDHAAKKAKFNHASEQNNTLNNSLFDNDVWGDDFNEEEMVKEVDFVVSLSQRTCQKEPKKPNGSTNFQKPFVPTSTTNFSKPSTSGLNHQTATNNRSNFASTVKTNNLVKTKSEQTFNKISKTTVTNQTQILAGSNAKQTINSSNINYDDFVRNDVCHSTQQSNKSLIKNFSPVSAKSSENSDFQGIVEKNRELENQNKLHIGEIQFCRNQVKKSEDARLKDKINNEEEVKKLKSEHKAEVDSIKKEYEALKTQFEIKTLEYESLNDKFKYLKTGNVKLVKPSASVNDSTTSKLNSFYSRSESRNHMLNNNIEKARKSAKYDDVKSGIVINHPLIDLPDTIYETSSIEKPVVNVHFVEKSGRGNMAHLLEDDSLRIFENPELVKPLVTTIGDKELKVQFFLPELYELITKTEKEINSISTMKNINKLIATTRELLLNSTTVLQKISRVMTNDDIRDMNDTYFSEMYSMPVSHKKTIFDGSLWYEKERGIEARRSLGVLCHVAQKSTYLSEYIGGKSLLITENDSSYNNYIKYMKNFNCWELKNTDYEFLKLLLNLVTIIRIVRRAHQFSGLLNAVALTLINAHKRVPFREPGVKYVYDIVKEIVLSRPLLQSFIPLSQLLETFGSCSLFMSELLKLSDGTSSNVQGIICYKADACILEMYLKQLQYFILDPITTIKITDALVTFMSFAMSEKVAGSLPKYFTEFNQFILKLLYDCLSLDTEALKHLSRERKRDSKMRLKWYNTISDDWKFFSDKFWDDLRFVQFKCLKRGVIFLDYLLTNRPNVYQLLDSEVLLSIFLDKIIVIDGIELSENEKEAINDLKTDLKKVKAGVKEESYDSQEKTKIQRHLYKVK